MATNRGRKSDTGTETRQATTGTPDILLKAGPLHPVRFANPTGRSARRSAPNLMEKVMNTHSKLTRSSRLSNSLRNGLLYTALAMAAAAPVHAIANGNAVENYQTLFNEFDLPVLDPATNTFGPNAIELVFMGDVCANIPAQYVFDNGIDPFYALEEYEAEVGGPQVTPTFTCTFDGTNSHAQWAGGTLPVPLPPYAQPPAIGWPIPLHHDNNGNLYVHSGINYGITSLTGLIPLYKQWIWTQTSPAQSMIIPVTGVLDYVQAPEKNPSYAALFIGAAGVAMPETGTWYLLSYQGTPEFTLSNNGPDTITLPAGESGIVTGIKGPTQEQCAVTPNCYETLLDQLNDQGYPEPGMEGSPFTPLKLPSQLAPGQTYTFKVKK
jgi:hypothetical protein